MPTSALPGKARHIQQPPPPPQPAAASFNESLNLYGAPAAADAPPALMEDVLTMAPTITPWVLLQLGLIVAMTASEYYAFMLGLEAPKQRPRAEENSAAPGEEIRRLFPALFPLVFLAGSMTRAGGEWLRRFGADNVWARQVAKGIGWVFNTSTHAFNSSHYRELKEVPPFDTHDQRAAAAMDAELKDWLRAGRIKVVTHHLLDPKKAARDRIILRILPIFMVEQNGKFRPVYDGRELNCDILNETFKLETVATTARLLRPGDYMFSADMWAGYAQVSLQEDLKAYCCFRWRNEVYRFEVLPFGINVAPRIYQKIMLTVFAEWRAQGNRCASYIDDGLWAVQGRENAFKLRERVLTDLDALGFQININPAQPKAHLEPSQAVTFLGYVFDTTEGQVRLFVPEKKIIKLLALVDSTLERAKDGSPLKGAEVARIVGQVLAMRHAYPPARLVTRELLGLIRQLPLREIKGADGSWQRVRDFSKSVTASAGAIFELRFLQRIREWNGAEWKSTTPTRTLYTDASGWGYGALLRRIVDSGEDELMAWRQAEHFMSVSTRDSVRTEQQGLLRALAEMPGLDGQVVLHRTDSMATFKGLTNGGYAVGEESDLNLNAKKIWTLALLRGIRLTGEFVGANLIIRSGADALSRSDFDDRLTLPDETYRRLCVALHIWPRVDLFADPETVRGALPFYTRLPLRITSPGYLGHDALSWPWEGDCYAFPPLHLAPMALEKAMIEAKRTPSTRIVLVVPWWPMRSWTALLAPYDYVELGDAITCTVLPAGARKPIESSTTWESLVLRAYVIDS